MNSPAGRRGENQVVIFIGRGAFLIEFTDALC
jgi:hypothetical protein